jgi:hypothetical protein
MQPAGSAWSAATTAAFGGVRLRCGRDGVEQLTDPVARQMALMALTSEHVNLQTAPMGTIAEANGRSALYRGTLSSAVIAIAFLGQANRLGASTCSR